MPGPPAGLGGRDFRPQFWPSRRSLATVGKELGLSQAVLGKLLGTSANTIACWERGDKLIGYPKRVAPAPWALKEQRGPGR